MMDRQGSTTRDDLEWMVINEDVEPKRLPFSLLADITSDFSDKNIIGSGGCARVYKGYIGNRTVAVKRLLPVIHLDEKGFYREIECLMKVKHKNIVRFLGYCYEMQGQMLQYNGRPVMAQEEERLLCFQYLPKGGLDKYITDASSGLEWEQRYHIINGVCNGLHHLHEHKIFHLDLKPQNILLDDDMVPKIADFGLSRCLEGNQTKVQTINIGGTMGYMAPEFIQSGVITKKCDLYSLGVIIMELLTGRKGCHDHAIHDVPDGWTNRLGASGTAGQLDQIRVCLRIGIDCSDHNPANRPPDTKDIIDRLQKVGSTQESQDESGKLLLQVHPTVLVFELQPGKLSPCSLQLTNDTDEHMAFKLSTADSVDWSEHFTSRPPWYGFVPARSTYTLILTLLLERDIPQKKFCDMTLESFRIPGDDADDDIILEFYTSDQSNDSDDDDDNMILESYTSDQPNDSDDDDDNMILESYTSSTDSDNDDNNMILESNSSDKPNDLEDSGHMTPESYTSSDQSNDSDGNEALFTAVKAENVVNDVVKLTAMLSMKRQSISMPTGLRVRISSMEKPRTGLLSIDAHPTKPWIITGHKCGRVSIQNHDTQKLLYSFKVSRGPVFSVKFIARRQWFISSSAECLIHVYSYESAKMQKINSFRAHDHGLVSLAVHPTQPYVMSWLYNHHEMKQWDWDRGWECAHTLHSNSVLHQVAFDPKENDRFAIASYHTVKVCSLDFPNYTLPGHYFDASVTFLEFFTRNGRQYLIIINEDLTAHVWDMRLKKFVTIKQRNSLSLEASLFSHPNLPILLAPSSEGICRFWSPKDFRIRGVLDNSGAGEVRGVACLMGSKRRFVIGQEDALTILHIYCGIHQEDPMQSIDPKTSSAAPSNNELIQVVPPELRFPVVQVVSSTLKIRNITGHNVAFVIICSSNGHASKYSASPDKGIVPPKKTLRIVVTRVADKEWVPAADFKLEEVVYVKAATVVVAGSRSTDVTLDMFDEMKTTGHSNVQVVKLDVAFVPSKIIPKFRLPWSLDVHPTEPWIMMTQGDYHVHIWNYETQEAKSIAIKGKQATSAKFIARKKWIIVGCSSGIIYVYHYDPAIQKNSVKKIRVLQGHSKSVNPLAVHATLPYVLSASQDGKILIWRYGNEWELMKTFHAKSHVMHVAFNPKDTTVFASAQDKTVKIWDLHSDNDCKLQLSGHSDLVVCLDYFSLGDKLYLITGSKDKTAKIWDCETGSCVQTLKSHRDAFKTVYCHPDLLILITGSWNGSVRLWDLTTFRHERTLNIDLGEVYAIASLKGSTRIALGNERGLALVDIALEDKKDGDVESTIVTMGNVIVPTPRITDSVTEDVPVTMDSVTDDVPIMASAVSESNWKNVIANSPVQFGSISDFLKQDMI